jgi:hypothetical protein
MRGSGLKHAAAGLLLCQAAMRNSADYEPDHVRWRHPHRHRAEPIHRTSSGGECAMLHHQGPYASMRAAYQWLYGQWLVQSGYAAAHSPLFGNP